jgi:hypothetical protein
LKKEAIVESPNVKQIITETTKKVEVVVPKQTMDFEKLLVKDIAEL